jgi:plasmid stabilization system protein ParE
MSVARVVFAEGFRSDVTAQTRRLISEDRDDWARQLMEEIDAATALLGRSPRIGLIEGRRGKREIRRLLLRSLPLVVWYVFQARQRKVIVLRLFRVRQRRPG